LAVEIAEVVVDEAALGQRKERLVGLLVPKGLDRPPRYQALQSLQNSVPACRECNQPTHEEAADDSDHRRC